MLVEVAPCGDSGFLRRDISTSRCGENIAIELTDKSDALFFSFYARPALPPLLAVVNHIVNSNLLVFVPVHTELLKRHVMLPVGHAVEKLKVVWVYAKAHFAFVMDVILPGNVANEHQVGKPVGGNHPSAFPPKLSITSGSTTGGPNPTSSFTIQLKLIYETIKWWQVRHNNKKPTPTSEVNPAVKRGNAYQGGQDMFSRFWRLIQSRDSMVPIPS